MWKMERSICGTVWPPCRLAQVDGDGLSSLAICTTQQAPSLQWSVLRDAILEFGAVWDEGVDTEQVGFPVYLVGGTLVGSQGSPARSGAKT